MNITEEEVNRRLDANDGFLRKKIVMLGTAALWHQVTSKKKPSDFFLKKIRAVAMSWIANNGEAMDGRNEKFFRDHGLSSAGLRKVGL